MMQRVFLVGFMGVGKSTLGRIMSPIVGLPFFDFDQYLEARQEQTIADIFANRGEGYFRMLEHDLLREFIQTYELFLLGTGGGLPCFGDNMQLMNEVGITVYLRASAEAIVSRLLNSSGNRPLIKDRSSLDLLSYVTETLAHREKFYTQSNHIVELDLSGGKEQNAALILAHLGLQSP